MIDIGAGGCPYRSTFAHCEYVTQDAELLTPKAISEGSYGPIDIRCDATDIPLPDAQFDAVLCTEVLEHVPHPGAVIREAARLLRPGGCLILTAPLGSGLHQEPFHFYGGFTPHWYRLVLEEAGFTDVTISANGGTPAHFAEWCVRILVSLGRDDRPRGGVGAAAGIAAALTLAPLVLPAAFLALLADPLDRRRAFTVGYHVTARKLGPQS